MKITLLFLAVIFFTACETGTRYDKNTTTYSNTDSEAKHSVNSDIEALLDDYDEELDESVNSVSFGEREPRAEYIERSTCRGEVSSKALEVKSLRVGQHNGYTRLVFDVYSGDSSANTVGRYRTHYYEDRDLIMVSLEGYGKFSANFPTFTRDSIIEKIYFDRERERNGYRFYIKLRQEAEVKIFDLKTPARLVFDIKAI